MSTASAAGPRIAIACSGLGHVRRGIEAWAADTGAALRRAGADVTLYGAAGDPPLRSVACLRRGSAAARGLVGVFSRLGGWRYGMGSAYELEQTSFALALLPRIRRGCDIVHVQDPTMAAVLESAWRRGLSGARVILANGTDERPEVLARFSHLQLLTPDAAQAWAAQRPAGQAVFSVPNFVDTDRFVPGDRAAARAGLGLPPEATILLCCAAIKRHHKRIDALLRAVAALPDEPGREIVLVVAGGAEAETAEMQALGASLLGPRVRFLVDFPRAGMAELYRAADLFVLASLHETFGIVLLEAMASGLAVVCHDTPGFRYVTGPAGSLGFTVALAGMLDPAARAPHAGVARAHVEKQFSEPVVAAQMRAMYRTVAEGSRGAH